MSTKQKSPSQKAVKHRKVLRNNLQGITKPALLRLLRRAGVKRVSGLIYEDLKSTLKSWLEKVVGLMVTFTEHARRKTVNRDDLYAALSECGIELAAGLNENSSKTASLKSGSSRGKGVKKANNVVVNVDSTKVESKLRGFADVNVVSDEEEERDPEVSSSKEEEIGEGSSKEVSESESDDDSVAKYFDPSSSDEEDEGAEYDDESTEGDYEVGLIEVCDNVTEKKKKKRSQTELKPTHRFHPGTVALRQIRYFQKNSDSLAIPKLNFNRLVREVAQEYNPDLRFSEGVVDLLQLTAENYLVSLAEDANLCAIHADRETLLPKDLHLVRRIRNDKFA